MTRTAHGAPTRATDLTPAHAEMYLQMMNECTVTGMYLMRGTAGTDCPTGAPVGGVLRKVTTLDNLYSDMLRWQGMGRTITHVTHWS